SNIEKDFEWMKSQLPEGLVFENHSDNYAQLALQGPAAESILQLLTDESPAIIPFFGFMDQVDICGFETLVARTGYTGEDGFEIYCKPEDAVALWDLIVDAGALPCGLGARDTLRFEACMPLYGQELSQTISPVEAGLNFAVKTDIEADFIGKDILKN